MTTLRCPLNFAIAAVLALGILAAVSPAIGRAAECGPGTVFDPPSNMCVLPAPPPPPPPPPLPPPPPAWNGDFTPGFSVSVCAPIPFISLCTGI